MIWIGVALLVLLLGFAFGAWLMLTSVRPRSHVGTYCTRCGEELADPRSDHCPRCRRLLSPEMRVTCSRGEIDRRRLALGGLLVGVLVIAAPIILGALRAL